MKLTILYTGCLLSLFGIMSLHSEEIKNRVQDLMEKTKKAGEIKDMEKPAIISTLKKIVANKKEGVPWDAEFLGASLLLIDLGDEQANKGFQGFLMEAEKADLSGIKENEKPLIISELRKIAAVFERQWRLAWYQHGTLIDAKFLLVNLGDGETIKDVVQQYKKHNPADHPVEKLLRRCKQPLLIPLIADDLKIEEVAEWQLLGGDVLVWPRSVASAQIISCILMNSPVFRDDVKKSASGHFRSMNSQAVEEERKAFRQWWQENEGHFAKKDYAAVRPLKATPAAQVPADE